MGIAWTERFAEITPAGTGWQNYDIFTTLSVPKGAVAYILMLNGVANSEQDLGVRTDESVLARFLPVHESEAPSTPSFNGYHAWVTVHATTGYIETYCDTTTNVKFYLMGYLTGATYTELFQQIEADSQNAWDNEDVSAYLPASVVAEIAMVQTASAWYASMGVRTPGSSIERRVVVHECEPTDGDNVIYTNFVKVNASQQIELFSQYTASPDRWHYILGYFNTDIDYVEAWTAKAIVNDAAWEAEDLTSDIDQDGRLVNVCIFNTNGTTGLTMGLRGGDSVLNRYYLEHEAEPVGATAEHTGSNFVAKTNSTGNVGIYGSVAANTVIYFAGYFKFTEDVVTTPTLMKRPVHQLTGRGKDARRRVSGTVSKLKRGA